MDLDVWVVVGLLGRRTDTVHEGQRLGEVGELELAFERAVHFDPSGRAQSRRTEVSQPKKEWNRCDDCFFVLAVLAPAADRVRAHLRDEAQRHDGTRLTITLKKAGVKVKTLKPGAYTITVSDKSTQHDFVLTGPGIRTSASPG